MLRKWEQAPKCASRRKKKIIYPFMFLENLMKTCSSCGMAVVIGWEGTK
jgi:predicted dithiol-disulfide oxidoreductase (DUF899 family)